MMIIFPPQRGQPRSPPRTPKFAFRRISENHSFPKSGTGRLRRPYKNRGFRAPISPFSDSAYIYPRNPKLWVSGLLGLPLVPAWLRPEVPASWQGSTASVRGPSARPQPKTSPPTLPPPRPPRSTGSNRVGFASRPWWPSYAGPARTIGYPGKIGRLARSGGIH